MVRVNNKHIVPIKKGKCLSKELGFIIEMLNRCFIERTKK